MIFFIPFCPTKTLFCGLLITSTQIQYHACRGNLHIQIAVKYLVIEFFRSVGVGFYYMMIVIMRNVYVFEGMTNKKMNRSSCSDYLFSVFLCLHTLGPACLENEQFIIFCCSLVVFYTFCQSALVRCQLYLCFVAVHCFPHLCQILNLYLLAGKPYLTIHVCLNEGCGLHVARSHTILLRCQSLAARCLFGLISCGNTKSLAAAFMILLSLG